jgi:predicted Zn-dependent protease
VTIIVLLIVAETNAAVSYQAERELGSQFDLAVRQELPLVTDPDIVMYVDRIGQSIAKQLDDSFFEYHFAVVREASLNAFAVPGGYIYVHTGLLTRARDDDEIAGVLGHEIAHVHAHHLARQQEATQLVSYASLLGLLLSFVHPALGAGAVAANAATQLSYRREFEQEADYLGARYMGTAGYDPRGMLDFFKKMADEHRLSPTIVPRYLQSHPLTDERLNNLEAVLKTHQWTARERPPQPMTLQRLQVVARARSEPPGEVVAAYRSALEAKPNDPTARYLFGVACLETGQLDAAHHALEAAHKQGVAAAERDLGRLALRMRHAQEARDRLRRVLATHPQDAEALVALGQAYEILGDAEASLTTYRRVVTLVPDFESAHHALGLVAGRLGHEAEGLYHLATAALLGGGHKRALGLFLRAEKLMSPTDLRLGTLQARVRELRTFLHLRPDETPGPTPRSRYPTPRR